MDRHISIGAIGRWSAVVLIAAGLYVLVLQTLHATPAKDKHSNSGGVSGVKQITDRGITNDVEDGLIFEYGVFPNDVDVATGEGIVTLSGSVDNILAKERTVKIAESIRGVRGVINRLIVTPVSRPDGEIRADILTALQQDPATELFQVGVSVKDAVATLSGSVGSYTEKQLTARIARGVTGVKDVLNDVMINYGAKRTDPEIEAEVKARLKWDIWINENLIYAAVKDGNVTLTGMVGSVLGKSRAFDDAWVIGVKSVDDGAVKVEPWARNVERRKSKYAIRSDGEIKEAVQAAFRLDPRVSAFSPDVTVENGVIRLTGVVGNLKAKASAEQDAKNIVGVWLVDNFLKVRPKDTVTDAEAKKQLTAALIRDPLLVGSTIDAAVTNHVASLSGSVGTVFQKTEAQDVASRTKGVLLVRNSLRVEPGSSISSYYDYPEYYSSAWPEYYHAPHAFDMLTPWPFLSDEQIKKNIEDRFFWSPYVDGRGIKVTVEKGVATLTGAVGTWIGWDEADKDAHMSGAAGVLNRITVRKGGWVW